MFTVTKVNGPTIIVRRNRDGKVFARNISMVKQYKYISDSDDHSDIDKSGSAEINTEIRIQTIEEVIRTVSRT